MVWLARGLRGCSACCRPSSSRLIDAVTQQLVHRHWAASVAAQLAGARADQPAARQLRSADFPARHPRVRCLRSCWCAGSTTAACAAAPPWDCGFPGRPRACRTRPKASASRSGRFSSPSSACSASCPRRSIAPALSRTDRGPFLVLALSADGALIERISPAGRPAAARPHFGLPAVQLPRP